MANLTLTEGRAKVLKHLDDESGITGTSRFNPDGAFTDLDIELANSASKCISDVTAGGRDEFIEESTVTTSATDGTVSLSSLGAVDLRSVVIDLGNAGFGKVKPIRRQDRLYLDLVARSLIVGFVREYPFPTNPAHPLIGNGATAANTWLAFDHWVCVRAALALGCKDKVLGPALSALEADQRQSVVGRTRLPRSSDFPGEDNWYTSDLRFTYLRSTKVLQMVRAR